MSRLAAIACMLAGFTLALEGCDQMKVQRRLDADEATPLFADGKVNQTPPDGAVAQEDAAFQAAAAQRPAMSEALLRRGQERYAIACAQCHDAAGYGAGVLPARGFPRPESFHTPRLRAMPARHVVDVIANGQGTMFAQADRVAPADRWAIAAYVQALQASQAAPGEWLTAQEQARADHGS